MENYILFRKYYDKNEFYEAVDKLKVNNINFKYKDKSNLPNYRIPSSTYIEIDLYISENDYEIVKKVFFEN